MTDASDADDRAADFGDAFDALPDLDSGSAPGLTEPLPDTWTDEALRVRKARLTQALVQGETGVGFDALALFAEPLFTLYELDPALAFSLRSDPDHADEETLALLETARVLWAFFSLPPSERSHQRQVLAAQLVGEEPTPDDWMDLDALLDAAEIHWQALLPDEVAGAQRTGHPTLDFTALMQHPAFHVGRDGAEPAGFGPDSLSEVEARALFAQTLLDEVSVDPDAFELAIARADDYWDLAHEPDPQAAAEAWAAAQDDPDEALAEATAMLARYRELFPGATA